MGSKMATSRQASHAGSWYTDQGNRLNEQLSEWLDGVENDGYPVKGCKAIIAPHAGYSYSGRAAAYAYKSIDTTGVKRVFILGPSHHVYLDGCALSRCDVFETPIGDLKLDLETIEKLRKTGKFVDLNLEDDEAEHSIEMHLPYVRKVFEGKDIQIVPIVVGSISQKSESVYGQLLAPYLAEPDTIFVVSSDFCHWGTRFTYTFYYPSPPPSPSSTHSLSETYDSGIRLTRSSKPSSSYPIHQSIRSLDHQAIDILTISPQSPPPKAKEVHDNFAEYLSLTKNTICGRHPIGVLLGALKTLPSPSSPSADGEDGTLELRFVRYEQSNQCMMVNDSSVSYASAWVKF